MIDIGLACRVVAAFDIAVICCDVKRGPPACVGLVNVRAAIDQVRGELVVAVLRCRSSAVQP
jgi:hypothetical protein